MPESTWWKSCSRVMMVQILVVTCHLPVEEVSCLSSLRQQSTWMSRMRRSVRSEQKKSSVGEMSDEWLHVWKTPMVFQLKVTVLSGDEWSLCKLISLLFRVSCFVNYSLFWLVGRQAEAGSYLMW